MGEHVELKIRLPCSPKNTEGRGKDNFKEGRESQSTEQAILLRHPSHVPVAVYSKLRYFPMIPSASSSLPRLPPMSMLSDKAASRAVGGVTVEASEQERARVLAFFSISGEFIMLCSRCLKIDA